MPDLEVQALRESTPAFPHVTLGILAGGRATRLHGIEKAWLQQEGVPQVLRLRELFASQVKATLASANRDLPRYMKHGLHTVTDRILDAGPLSGVDALAGACQTDWLLTLPVDVVAVPPDLLARLAASGRGAFVEDDDGSQPLIALWPVAETKDAVASALTANAFAVHELQARLKMSAIRFEGFRFGNLNTPDDLDAAGIALAASD